MSSATVRVNFYYGRTLNVNSPHPSVSDNFLYDLYTFYINSDGTTTRTIGNAATSGWQITDGAVRRSSVPVVWLRVPVLTLRQLNRLSYDLDDVRMDPGYSSAIQTETHRSGYSRTRTVETWPNQASTHTVWSAWVYTPPEEESRSRSSDSSPPPPPPPPPKAPPPKAPPPEPQPPPPPPPPPPVEDDDSDDEGGGGGDLDV